MEERVVGHFLSQPNKDFPVECETFAHLQNNISILAMLGAIAGDKTILYGCELTDSNTRRTPGMVFLCTKDYPQGEVIYWEGGSVTAGITLKVDAMPTTALGVTYAQPYTKRKLIAGIGSENYSWSDFKVLATNQQLDSRVKVQDEEISRLRQAPLGVAQIWAGAVTSTTIPANYALCDGSQLKTSDYPALYDVIGLLHTPKGTPTGYFCLPDLRSKFVVGFDGRDTDYSTMGNSGGEKKVTLAVEDMPKHAHSVDDYYFIEDIEIGSALSGKKPLGGDKWGNKGNDTDNSSLWYYTHPTEETGNDRPHENRPPYYTLAYIMRLS